MLVTSQRLIPHHNRKQRGWSFLKPESSQSENLGKIEVPLFQRWIVEKNKTQLKESIDEVGMLRCPVIFYVKEKDQLQIIDGNHMREIIIAKDSGYISSDKITCIYQEVDKEIDAAKAFRFLNTKGKNLDWVDLTNLYMYVKGNGNVYESIWTLLRNPRSADEIILPKGFSVPTIVEFIAGDKEKYRNGIAEFSDPQIPRTHLLAHLMIHANNYWDSKIPKDGRRPTGAAIIGFANYWFKEKYHDRYDDNDFLTFITNIFLNKTKELESGDTVINRDNAGKLLKNYLHEHSLTIEQLV